MFTCLDLFSSEWKCALDVLYCTVELPIQTYRDRDRGIASTSDVDVFCRREDFLSSSSRVRKIFKTPKKS